MKLNRNLIAAVVLGALVGANPATAQTPDADVKALLQRVQELEQKVKTLEGKETLAKEAATEKSKTTPTVSIGANGLQATSADTNFTFALHGLLQIDSRTFFDDGGIQGNDAFLVRRARPIFSGTVFRDLISC